MSSPARLQKREEDLSIMTRISVFLNKYADIIFPVLIMVLLFLIIALVVMVFIDMTSAQNLSMLESGTYYNHLENIV